MIAVYDPPNNATPLIFDGAIVPVAPYDLFRTQQKPELRAILQAPQGYNIQNGINVPVSRIFTGINNAVIIDIAGSNAPFTLELSLFDAGLAIFRTFWFRCIKTTGHIELFVSDFIQSFQLNFNANPDPLGFYNFTLLEQTSSTINTPIGG